MITIRKAAEKDIPRILDLYEQLTEEKHELTAVTLKRIFNEVDSFPQHEFMVAEKDGRVVGSVTLQIIPSLAHGARPWGILEFMIVDSGCRREGIAKLLINHAAERCRKAGCHKLQLVSNIKRKEAHQLYRSMGFEDSAIGFRIYF